MTSILHMSDQSRTVPRLHWKDPYIYCLTRLRAKLEEAIVRHVTTLPRAQDRKLVVVDFGCGSMPYKPFFEAFTATYFGMDLESNPVADSHINRHTGSVSTDSEVADVILSTQVLEHVEDPAAYLREAHRICRPDGLLILSTHGLWRYHPGPEDYWRWTGTGLRRILEAQGWQLVDLRGIMGLTAVSAQLFQDALAPKLPGPVRIAFTVLMQRIVQLVDLPHTAESRWENSGILFAVARCGHR